MHHIFAVLFGVQNELFVLKPTVYKNLQKSEALKLMMPECFAFRFEGVSRIIYGVTSRLGQLVQRFPLCDQYSIDTLCQHRNSRGHGGIA